MNERIRELRKALNLNQTEFGERIGIKQGSIAGYESGARTPIDSVILSMCREFNVNEEWLRTGEGDMFIPMTRDEQIEDFMGEVLRDEPNNFKKRLISALAKLSEHEWEVLEHKLKEIVSENEEEN